MAAFGRLNRNFGLALVAAFSTGSLVMASRPAVPTMSPATSPATMPATGGGSFMLSTDMTFSGVGAPGGAMGVPTTAPSPFGPEAAAQGTPVTPGAPAATQEALAVTQAFVGTISGDRVYVRSGPGAAYYEMGQLTRGDMVYVVGSSRGWYQILPPNGTYCMIAKEFVDVEAGGRNGLVKGDYVNVRAGTAIYKQRDPSAVLTVVRKGTALRIIGQDDKYYMIAPPERALVYVSPQFVQAAAAGAEYRVPDIKYPSGVTGLDAVTVTQPQTLPTATVVIPNDNGTGSTVAGGTGVGNGVAPTQPQPGTQTLPPIEPARVFSSEATAKYNELSTRYQAETRKPAQQQNAEGLIREFRDVLAMANISPTVKSGAEAHIKELERVTTVQRLIREQAAADERIRQQRDAYREQYENAEKAIAAARDLSSFVAEGILQSSTIVQGKYALVNPDTGRVVAYVDPSAAQVDISIFIGKYVGLKGTKSKAENSEMELIKVSSATLIPQPGAGPR